MYSTGPPATGDRPGTGRLRIVAMARRVFDGPPAIAGNPGHRTHLRGYLSDLARPYGGEVGVGPVVDEGHSYGEMAAALIDDLVRPDRPVGLLVLAFAIPDVRPGRATAAYLSHLCPGTPLAFAVCDQGGAAAFTGLRLVRDYAGPDTHRRSLLLVVEQAALPHEPALPAKLAVGVPASRSRLMRGPLLDLPARHTAVGLLLDDDDDGDGDGDRDGGGRDGDGGGAARVESLRQHADVAPAVASRLLRDALSAAATDGGVGLIVNEGLAGASAAGPALVAPAGRPHTGVWWELADILSGPGADLVGGRLMLAVHDRGLRYLCLSTIKLPHRSSRSLSQ